MNDRAQRVTAPRLHVAICTDGVFPLATGGMQRHSRLLVESLAQSGEVDLTVLHPHPIGQFEGLAHVREASLEPIHTGRLYLRELWRYSQRTAAVLDQAQPDLILSQGFSVWAGLDRFRDRLIFHPHGLEMFQGLTAKERLMGTPFRGLVRHLARRARVTISLGGKLTGILNALGARDLAVLPNAVVVPDQIPERPRHQGPVQFLFVGRFAFNKGIDLLIEVARRMESDGIPAHFRLAGGGPMLEHFRQAGLPSNVELLGRVDDDELFRLYATTDCFVLPTRFEGMPTVVLEAMARACPVVVSDVGATADLVRDGVTGFLLPPGDGEALYQGLLRFMDLPLEQKAQMGAEGFHLARTTYAWPAVAQGYLQLFRKLTAAS